MDWRKLTKALLFPCVVIRIILLPFSIVFLVYSMVFLGTQSPISIISYVIAAYTLTVWCFKIPDIIEFFKGFKNENKYVRLWQEDTRLRINTALYTSLIWNIAYALLQMGMGFHHRSFWFCSLAGYYISLAVMRFFLVRHTRKHNPGERMFDELKKYRACGVIFLLMNLTLALMVFFMVYWNRTFHHHEITTIALATYTFTSLTVAIVNIVKYRKYNSPVYSASKAISLASACVSMLTLESTMLTTFGDGTISLTERRILLGLSGAVISVFIIAMAIYMILQATKRINSLETRKKPNGKQRNV